MTTGWILFSVMVFLAAFNTRKKLAMLPLGSARVWLHAHMAGGLLALALFWLHTGSVWPHGLYLKALAACFYLVSARHRRSLAPADLSETTHRYRL